MLWCWGWGGRRHMCPNCCEDAVLPVWLVWHLWSTEKRKSAHFKSLFLEQHSVCLRMLTSPSGIPSGDGTSQLLAYLSFLKWWAHMHFLTSPASSYGHVSEYQPRKYGEAAHPIPGMHQKHCYAWSSFSASMHWLIKKIWRRTEPEDAKDLGHHLPEKRLYTNSHWIVTWRKNRLSVKTLRVYNVAYLFDQPYYLS